MHNYYHIDQVHKFLFLVRFLIGLFTKKTKNSYITIITFLRYISFYIDCQVLKFLIWFVTKKKQNSVDENDVSRFNTESWMLFVEIQFAFI